MATHNIQIIREHHPAVSFTRDDGTADVAYGTCQSTALDIQATLGLPADHPGRADFFSSSSDLAHMLTGVVVQEYVASTLVPYPADETSLFWYNLVVLVPDIRHFESCDRAEAEGLVLRKLNSRDKYGRVIYPAEDVRILEDDLVLVVGKKVPYMDICIPAIKD
jgi:hypothetical protein